MVSSIDGFCTIMTIDTEKLGKPYQLPKETNITQTPMEHVSETFQEDNKIPVKTESDKEQSIKQQTVNIISVRRKPTEPIRSAATPTKGESDIQMVAVIPPSVEKNS